MAHHIKPTNEIVVMLQNISNEYEVEQISRNFANLASHQLRTPLAVINTHIHLLADGYMGKLGKNQQVTVRTVLDAAEHMNDLLNMLLDISKLENKKYERRFEEVKIEDILGRIRLEVKDKVSEKEINFIINLPKEPPAFISDSHMLHEIFSNIITNAVKYTPAKGTVRISVEFKKTFCVVATEDSGIGIPKQVQDKIFTQFFRAENAIDSQQSGTGLGLYLVKQLIKLLNGEIKFKSEFKKGTTFIVTLPIK